MITIIFNFCFYKDPIDADARPISYAAKSIKFEEDIKIMAQRYKLWRKRLLLAHGLNGGIVWVSHKF
jgi:hypothetical protein